MAPEKGKGLCKIEAILLCETRIADSRDFPGSRDGRDETFGATHNSIHSEWLRVAGLADRRISQ
jgi:hypothetical protein